MAALPTALLLLLRSSVIASYCGEVVILLLEVVTEPGIVDKSLVLPGAWIVVCKRQVLSDSAVKLTESSQIVDSIVVFLGTLILLSLLFWVLC